MSVSLALVSKSPRAFASAANFAQASRKAGVALGKVAGGRRLASAAALAARSAPAVTGSGAPVVRRAPSGKDEGRVPSVSRVESRPSESGRQDLNLRPLGPEPDGVQTGAWVRVRLSQATNIVTLCA